MDSKVVHISAINLRRGRADQTRTAPEGPLRIVSIVLLAVTLMLSACGGGSSSGSNPHNSQVSGNWQFNLAPGSLDSSPLQGGFLVQKNGTLTGQIAFSIVLPGLNGGTPTICNSGTATITQGTITGQTVSITAAAGTLAADGTPATQTITLSGGMLSSDNSNIQNGTYSLTDGYYVDSQGAISPCGVAATDTGNWSAASVPPVTGAFQGFFHSARNGTGFTNQNFPVTGTLLQGENTGASSATVTGTLIFRDPVSLVNNYPCLSTASVTGTISGNNLLLQIFGSSGTAVGQIGKTPGSANPPTAVIFEKSQSGYFVHNPDGAVAGGSGGGYVVATKPCPNGDSGNVCLALGSSPACNQPIKLSPFALTFFPTLIGTTENSQTITLSNITSESLTGLKLNFAEHDSAAFYQSGGDFNGIPSFTSQDTCTPESNFSLAPSGQEGSSCTITVSYSPQQSCSWLPNPIGISFEGTPPAQCPTPVTAALTITVPSGSADADNVFAAPITGSTFSSIAPSVPELDFGAQAVGESSPPQTLTFRNLSPDSIQILPTGAPCAYPTGFNAPPLPRPPVDGEGTPLVGGIQVAAAAAISGLNNSGPIVNDISLGTTRYFCDTDPPGSLGGSGRPNFQISEDGCSGQMLQPAGHAGDSCSLQVTFVPQPATWKLAGVALTGLDDFLELNTTWCGDANNAPEPNCEIDSGRFPVEIKTNAPSPLRMTPAAALEFGTLVKGTESNPLTITLFNDPVDPNSATINFTSKLLSGSDYVEIDNCPTSLAPNESCQITVTFTPKVVGLDPGNIMLTYNSATQTGITQKIYLRGMGQ